MNDLEIDFQYLVKELNDELSKVGATFQFNEHKSNPGRGYSFKAPKTLAWVEKKPKLGCLDVGTKQKWADKASLHDYAPKDNSQFNEPGARWRISNGNSSERRNMVRYLVRIWRARQ